MQLSCNIVKSEIAQGFLSDFPMLQLIGGAPWSSWLIRQ